MDADPVESYKQLCLNRGLHVWFAAVFYAAFLATPGAHTTELSERFFQAVSALVNAATKLTWMKAVNALRLL